VPQKHQLELTELQRNSVLRSKFENVDVNTLLYINTLDQSTPNKRIDIEDHLNVRWYFCLRTAVLFDELASLDSDLS